MASFTVVERFSLGQPFDRKEAARENGALSFGVIHAGEYFFTNYTKFDVGRPSPYRLSACSTLARSERSHTLLKCRASGAWAPRSLVAARPCARLASGTNK